MNSMVEFYQSHAADDIVYALQHPEYYKLTQQQSLDLHSLVFAAIDKDKEHSLVFEPDI